MVSYILLMNTLTACPQSNAKWATTTLSNVGDLEIVTNHAQTKM